METLIMGIDPGSKITGWGVVKKSGNKTTYVDAGIIELVGKSKPDLFFKLYQAIESLLERFPIDEIACESQFVLKNAQSAMMISNAKTCLYIASGKKQIPVFEYAPKKAKVAVAGHGSADKSQVAKMIRLHLNVPGPLASFDASDALALALCHAFQLKPVNIKL